MLSFLMILNQDILVCDCSGVEVRDVAATTYTIKARKAASVTLVAVYI